MIINIIKVKGICRIISSLRLQLSRVGALHMLLNILIIVIPK